MADWLDAPQGLCWSGACWNVQGGRRNIWLAWQRHSAAPPCGRRGDM